MAVSNKVIEIGRLSQEPQLRRTNNNTAVCNFNIAVQETYKDQNGQYPVNYFYCEAWGKVGENIAHYCRKGSKVAVEGRLRQTVRQGQDGKNIYEVRIVVETIEFLTPKNQQTQQTQQNQQQGYQNNQNYNQNGYNQNYQGNQQYQQNQQQNYQQVQQPIEEINGQIDLDGAIDNFGDDMQF